MLGLIKQLAKLITLAKNFPKLLSLIPMMFTSLPSLISQASSQPQINKINEQNEQLQNDLQNQRNTKIQRINNDNTLTPNQKSMRIDLVNSRYDELESSLLDPAITEQASQNVIQDNQSKIEPAIQSATAPLAMAIGIPTGINYITNLLGSANLDGGLNNFENVVSSGNAESKFNKDINAIASETGDGIFSIGELDPDQPTTLRLISTEEVPTLRLQNGTILPIYINVNDPRRSSAAPYFGLVEIYENPNFQIRIIEFNGVPESEKSMFVFTIDNNGIATIETNRLPNINFSGSIKLNISGNKLHRLAPFFAPTTLFTANNIVTIPIDFTTE